MSISSQDKTIFSFKLYFFQWGSTGKSLLYNLNVMRFHGLEAFWIFMDPNCDVVSNYEYNNALRQ